jgi:hypothetical protein
MGNACMYWYTHSSLSLSLPFPLLSQVLLPCFVVDFCGTIVGPKMSEEVYRKSKNKRPRGGRARNKIIYILLVIKNKIILILFYF